MNGHLKNFYDHTVTFSFETCYITFSASSVFSMPAWSGRMSNGNIIFSEVDSKGDKFE